MLANIIDEEVNNPAHIAPQHSVNETGSGKSEAREGLSVKTRE